MVTRYDVISFRRSSHFLIKMHIFQLLSTIKIKLVNRMKQSTYLCFILHIMHKRITDGKILDGDLVWWCHRPPAVLPSINIPYLEEKIEGFSLKVKSFLNNATLPKLYGGFPSAPLPPCTRVGLWLIVYVRGLIQQQRLREKILTCVFYRKTSTWRLSIRWLDLLQEETVTSFEVFFKLLPGHVLYCFTSLDTAV